MGSRGTRMSAAQSSSRRRTRGSSASLSSTCSSVSSPHPRLSVSHTSSASSSAPSTPEPVAEHDIVQYATMAKSTASSVSDDIHGVIVNPHIHSVFSPFPQADSPIAENQLFSLFMNNSFCEPSTTFADYGSSFDMYHTPSAFSDVDQMDPFSSWTNSIPDSGPMEQIPFPHAPSSFDHNSSPLLGSQGMPNDIGSTQMDTIPTGADYFTIYPPMTTSPQPSRYSSPTIQDMSSSLADAQVTISNIASMPDRASIQVAQPAPDPSDRRVAVAVAICDRQDIGSTVQSLSQSLSAILCRPPSPLSQ